MKVTVIGSGFSGLVTAYYLRKRGVDVEVVDKAKHCGGLISTIPSDYGAIETAANGLLNSFLVEDMFEDLGIVPNPTRKQAKKRFIFRKKPRQWPLSFGETLGFGVMLFLKLLMGFRRSLKPRPGESIAAWAKKHFGEKFLNYMLAPALQGIYAGDVSRLSATLILGRLLEKKPKTDRKLLVRGTVAPRKGMGQLIEALQQWLKENQVSVKLDTQVVWNPKVTDWKWVVATSANDAARILAAHPVGSLLNSIEVSPVVSITAFFHPLDAKTKGFGVLFPRDQGVRALGVLFNNEIFENRSDHRSETWIYGGALDHEVFDLSEPELISQLMMDRKVVERGISKPLHYRIQKWPTAIPHYTIGLEKILSQLPSIENTYLVGNYLGGLGLSKILERAHDVAAEISAHNKDKMFVRKLDHAEARYTLPQSGNS